MARRLKVGESYEWTDDVDELIGTISDTTLARALKVGVRTVARRRQKLGKKPYRQPRKPKQVRCVVCGEPFEAFPGVGRMRQTHPAPWPCEALLRDAQRALKSPPSFRKALLKIPGGKFLLDD